MKRPINALTFDIEEWFHLPNIERIKPIREWLDFEERIVKNVEKILNNLNHFNIKATFFILGWVAEHYPKIVKKIANDGHEIGTHGYYHLPVFSQKPGDFEKDLVKSIDIIESVTGKKVLGHRAPFFSIKEDCDWAFDIISKCGLKYDSSIFPTYRSNGGITSGRFKEENIFFIKTKHGKLLEFPLSMFKIFGKNIPVCGGGYFRAYPYALTNFGLKSLNDKNKSFMLYFHPRDFDPNQPVLNIPFYQKMKSYIGLRTSENKFKKLLSSFNFAPSIKVINHFFKNNVGEINER